MRKHFMIALLALLPGTVLAGEAEVLIRQLGDEDVDKREDASRRLVALGQDAVPALMAAREDPDPEIRQRILGVLKSISWRVAVPDTFKRAHPELAEALPTGPESDQLKALRLLREELGAESVRAAVMMLEFGTRRVRASCMAILLENGAALAHLREPGLLGCLAGVLDEESVATRVLATRIAGLWALPVGEPDDFTAALRESLQPRVFKALRDPDAGLRAAAARGLGGFQNADSGEALLGATQDESAGVREAALSALAVHGHERGREAARKGLSDKGADVVRAAALACIDLKVPGVAEDLRRALGMIGVPPATRRALLEAVATLEPPGVDDATPWLADDNAIVRVAAWRIVLEKDAAQASRAAADDDATVRLVAARALARGGKAAIATLMLLLDDERSATICDARDIVVVQARVSDAALQSLEKVTGRHEDLPSWEDVVAAWKAWWAKEPK